MLEDFNTKEACVRYLELIRWPEGPYCPYCNSRNPSVRPGELRYHCNNCNTSYSVTVKTLFHNTHVPLQKWFSAILIFLNAKDYISVRKLSDAIGVNRNTAWRMVRRIRNGMKEKSQREFIYSFLKNLGKRV